MREPAEVATARSMALGTRLVAPELEAERQAKRAILCPPTIENGINDSSHVTLVKREPGICDKAVDDKAFEDTQTTEPFVRSEQGFITTYKRREENEQEKAPREK